MPGQGGVSSGARADDRIENRRLWSRPEIGYHFFDALVVAVAIEAGCRAILS